MKWLFLLLLIINAGIFAWGYQHEQVGTQPAIEAGADVGNMRLISELSEDERQEIAATTVETGTEGTTAETEPPAQDHKMTPEEKPEQTDKAVTETEKEMPASDKTTEKESTSKPEVAAKEGPTTAAKDQEETQEQKPEQQIASRDQTPEQPEQKEQVKKGPETASRCGTIGPINDRQLAKEVMDDLEKSEFAAKLERKIEKEQIGYWVVIPPLEDGSQAQAKIDELAQVGLKDIWHFRGGGMKNAISLGMFSKKENAENFSKEVLQKGFKTEMQPRYHNKTNYLVKFTIAKQKAATNDLWRVVEQKYSKMSFSEQACE